jgi:hypothetical protein
MRSSLHSHVGPSVSHLRVLETRAPPDLPSSDELLGWVAARRPGELHEALRLSTSAAEQLAATANAARVSTDIAGTVLLEAAIVVNDVGVGARTPLRAAASSTAGVRRRLTAAETDYLRALTMRRRESAPVAAPATLSLPVRLVGIVADMDVDAAIDAVEIDAALAWETAALISGRTMAEWAFRVLLAKSAGA